MRRVEVVAGDGRRLQVVDSGPEGAPTILIHHGTPGAGLPFEDWLGDAKRNGLRLLAYSRPGYGGSTRLRGHAVAQAADDVRTIAAHLEIPRLATWGWSGGGPPALSCAARYPDLVVAVATVGSLAPYGADGLDYTDGMGQSNLEELQMLLRGEMVAKRAYTQMAATPIDTVGQLINSMPTLLPTVDSDVTRGQLGQWQIRVRREACSTGPDGWLDDELSHVRAWGFDVSEIQPFPPKR